jgi:uncharacterized Ntn-hydrolase superfamily protein
MTFSIVGHCARTGMAGVAITTSSIAVGSRCPHVRAGAGAVTTQNVTDPSIGPEVLALMADGMAAPQAVARVMEGRAHAEYRQVAAVDLSGRVAHVTGSEILGTYAVASGAGCVAAGNLLATTGVPAAMIASFKAGGTTHLAERLLAALEAGIAAGGEEGPTHSAALLVAHEQSWPLVDLRVDWTEDCPGRALRALWRDYEPQMNDYSLRALNPAAAPSYGVPGDE